MSRFTEYELEKKELTPISGYWAFPLVSLDEALKPFIATIYQLERSITEAKEHCCKSFEHGLTLDESAAVFLYTMEAGDSSVYRALNKTLREEDRNKVKPWFPFIKLFDNAVNKLPTIKGNIWRGVCDDVGKFYREGELLTWWSISSCSLSVNTVKSFINHNQNATLFMIEAVYGKNLEGYTNYPNEKEIILKLGTKLRVKNDTLKHGTLHIVQLEEITHNQPETLVTSSKFFRV